MKSVEALLDRMESIVSPFPPPLIFRMVRDHGPDGFMVLIACLLSLRSRDVMTEGVCKQLFALAKTPKELLELDVRRLELILQPLGMFRQKARVLRAVCTELVTRFNSEVPCDEADLLSLPGVGRKTANLVLSLACQIPAICVDTHVHRIANHLGLVKTKTPEETEQALKLLVPKRRWLSINRIFVVWGQHICRPNSRVCRCQAALDQS